MFLRIPSNQLYGQIFKLIESENYKINEALKMN
jgi:hypothetical protein